ncbi:hypothetical protein BDD12DRAFT_982731 [Trichophaea hybrida]|nr:hypothetical protein BDD12DRAFT_982731 [Trichophaea hybrida]
MSSMLGADIQLPSLKHTVESNVVSLEWLRDTPKFLTFWGLLENSSHNYYARRPDVTYNIYFNPSAQLHTDGLFVFCNQGSLEEFTQKVGATKPDEVSFGVFVLGQLLRQVVEDGSVFLQAISREIHTAVMHIIPDDFRNWYTENGSEDVLYLISRSEELSAQVKCAKETVYTLYSSWFT